MRILVCIDDTDNIDVGGTGELASTIAQNIKNKGWGQTTRITRHQLLVHPDIPYTSHNSSMCFEACIEAEYLDNIIQLASEILGAQSAEGSDPGLCITAVDKLKSPDRLIEFGHRAKKVVITKEEAYDLAKELGVHLSEHGGTGQGIIGALAGAGLRLSGSDGRFKGKIKIDTTNNVIPVKEILGQSKADQVESLDGEVLGENEMVEIEEDSVKMVLLNHKAVVLVRPTGKTDTPWEACPNSIVKGFSS